MNPYSTYEPTEQDLQDYAAVLQEREKESNAVTNAVTSASFAAHPAYQWALINETWDRDTREAFTVYTNASRNPQTDHFSLSMNDLAGYFRQELSMWRAA